MQLTRTNLVNELSQNRVGILEKVNGDLLEAAALRYRVIHHAVTKNAEAVVTNTPVIKRSETQCNSFTLTLPGKTPGLKFIKRVHAIHKDQGVAVTSKTSLPGDISDAVERFEEQEEHKELFQWTKQWYPVAVVDFLDPSRPHAMQLLGKDIVLWRDGSRQWRCFEDFCPHRLAPLSEGRVESDGTLLCAYHAPIPRTRWSSRFVSGSQNELGAVSLGIQDVIRSCHQPSETSRSCLMCGQLILNIARFARVP